MRTISRWSDLTSYGIDTLTGEACGLAMRMLCDVTEQGKALIERFLGGTITITAGSNWNGGGGEGPHVGSVMLPHSILGDLAAFILVTSTRPAMAVVTMGDGSVRELSREYLERYQALDRDRAPDEGSTFPTMIARIWRHPSEVVTTRNEHSMTGRVE